MDNNELNVTLEENENVKDDNNDFTEEDRKEANKLCLISIIMLVSSVLVDIIVLPMMDNTNSLIGVINSASEIVMLLSAGLMLFVRMLYPKSKFGKVLMWVYISLLALIMITVVGVLTYVIKFIFG